jgi:diaminohydroxyphosphoribosylaminopyrimidine deaminase/5-amino-6-(5-phosphoribosylamino)uracil reductase
MGEALALASKVMGLAWPNPAVGCVIIRDGKVVGRGQTQFGGRPHAERMALDQAGRLARGAAMYVTLEPCCHWGKTPRCTDAIISAGVAAVHASVQDSDHRVDGEGFRRLQQAGVRVSVGLGADEAMSILEGFRKRIRSGRPLVTISGSALDAFGMATPPFDGVLMTNSGGAFEIVTRPGVKSPDISGIDRHADVSAVMQELGRIGLTSVVILLSDPLAERCRAEGAVDYSPV